MESDPIADQDPIAGQERGAAALGPLVEGLGTSGRVLMIAAHPDDEDTQLITWLAKGRHVETAYLSLTRGDGGQNLIGNELGEALGAIRTEELLAARRIDGGKQYFTRAFDFGFSKNAEETLTQWSRDSIMRDVVTVVRAFRPHVIVAIFTGTPSDGHGHHQVSGILAREAYDLAGDTVRFPRAATEGYGPWTVSKFYRGASFRGQESATLRINVGEYNPVLGRSYSEIAGDSRSQHKSQAFGQLQRKGVRIDLLRREATRTAGPEDARQEQTIFDGIDTTWARFRPVVTAAGGRAALDSLPDAFAEARRRLDLFAPEKVVPALVRLQSLLNRICGAASADNPCASVSSDGNSMVVRNSDLHGSMERASARVEAALALATGVALEATVSREVFAIGEPIPVSVQVYNRGKLPLRISRFVHRSTDGVLAWDRALPRQFDPDSTYADSTVVTLRSATQPYWLRVPRMGAMFGIGATGGDEESSPRGGEVWCFLEVAGASFAVRAPVVYRYADPIRGEVNRPVAGAPAVTLSLDREVEYAPANSPLQRPVRVQVRSHAGAARDVTVRLTLPEGLVADFNSLNVTLAKADEISTMTFNVRGRLAPGRRVVGTTATSGGESFATGYTTIAYDHIRTQRLYRPSTSAIEAVDARLPRGASVAYINGVGDNSAPMLAQLGISVTVLDPAALPQTDLTGYSAIVVGPRAYEANAALIANNARLLDYVKGGGTLVVQYGQYEMTQPGIMPYPITLSRPADRVTVENAPVRILDPAASVVSTPNRIGTADLSGWIQDLSLYMPRTFDPAYKPVLETNDPGEPPNRGGLLVAAYGKGTYVYTSLAFFRQLPSGVPGAARLFMNLLAAKAGSVAQ